MFVNKFFCLGLAWLLNKPKTKAQAWFIYKQTNMNKLFIEPSPSCSSSVCFIYIPYYYRYNDMEECLETDFHLKNSTIARDNAWAWSQEFIIHLHQHCHLVFFIKKRKMKKKKKRYACFALPCKDLNFQKDTFIHLHKY